MTMTLIEAAAAGIERVTNVRWPPMTAFVRIDIIDGKPGPWLHSYNLSDLETGMNTPTDRLGLGDIYDKREWVAYTGPNEIRPCADCETYPCQCARTTCPGCNGIKTSVAHIHKRPIETSEWRIVPCTVCHGDGTITAAHTERIAQGKALRRQRLARRMTLLDAAKALGMSAAAYSRMERGDLAPVVDK